MSGGQRPACLQYLMARECQGYCYMAPLVTLSTPGFTIHWASETAVRPILESFAQTSLTMWSFWYKFDSSIGKVIPHSFILKLTEMSSSSSSRTVLILQFIGLVTILPSVSGFRTWHQYLVFSTWLKYLGFSTWLQYLVFSTWFQYLVFSTWIQYLGFSTWLEYLVSVPGI